MRTRITTTEGAVEALAKALDTADDRHRGALEGAERQAVRDRELADQSLVVAQHVHRDRCTAIHAEVDDARNAANAARAAVTAKATAEFDERMRRLVGAPAGAHVEDNHAGRFVLDLGDSRTPIATMVATGDGFRIDGGSNGEGPVFAGGPARARELLWLRVRPSGEAVA